MDQNLIPALKELGFVAVEFVLRESTPGSCQATVEVIPTRSAEPGVDIVSLYSPEIHDYLSGHSPMARYIINQDHLADNNRP